MCNTYSRVPDAYGLEVSIGLLKATGHALAVKNIEKVGEDELGRRLAELEARGQIYVLFVLWLFMIYSNCLIYQQSKLDECKSIYKYPDFSFDSDY
ncbi:hypothetical protein Tco_0139389 [Tanacetum coccineum]